MESSLIIISVAFGVVALALAVATIWLIVAAVISIATHPTATSNEKLLWILIALFLNIIGSILWFTIGRKSVGQTA